MGERTCMVPGCSKLTKKRRRCDMHDARLRLTGTTDPKPQPTHTERFWAKVNKDGPIPERRPDLGPCWLWTGAVSHNGKKPSYGAFADAEGRMRPAHVCSYLIAGRTIPDGYEVDHLCMVKLCVNPAHLEAVTQAENIRRAHVAYGIGHAKTHCKHGHEYTPENTVWVDGGKHRACRTCQRAKNQKRWADHKSGVRPVAAWPTPAAP